MKDLSKSDEQKALTALESAIELVGEGAPPNEAITKVAQESKLTAQMTQRMIEAYNISKTLHHLKTADGEKRADTFPLADPAVILNAMFPNAPPTEQAKAASALHPDYIIGGVSGDFMKAAHAVELPPMVAKPPLPYEGDPAARVKRAFDTRNNLIALQKKNASAARNAYYGMLQMVDKIASYWRQVGPKEPFELVEKRAVAEYGELGKRLMDLI